MDLSVDAEAAIGRLLRFLSVEGITGQEEAIGREVVKALVEGGVPAQGHPLRQGSRKDSPADADR